MLPKVTFKIVTTSKDPFFPRYFNGEIYNLSEVEMYVEAFGFCIVKHEIENIFT